MAPVMASSWSAPLPLPLWLTSQKSRSNGKVRLQGRIDALYLEYQRLVLQTANDDLIWVFFDHNTRLINTQLEDLKLGHRLQVDGTLQADRLQASSLRSLQHLL